MRFANGSILAAAVFVSATAHAQFEEPSGRSLDRWQPGLDVGAIAGLNIARTPGFRAYNLWLTAGYAGGLLVVVDSNADRTGTLLGPRFMSHLGGSLTLLPWLQLGANLPVVLHQARGDSPSSAFGPVGTLRAYGLGDLTLSAKVLLPTLPLDIADLAVVTTLSLPTHRPERAYLGDNTLTASGTALATRSLADLVLNANLGFHYRPAVRFLDAQIGSEIRLGIGASYNLESLTQIPMSVGAAWNLAARPNAPFAQINETPSELIMEGIYRRWMPFVVSLGVGVGVVAGIGTPDARVILGVRFVGQTSDQDADGIPDAEDACRDVAEDRDRFEDSDGCPDADNDNDAIADINDKCPNQAENQNDFEDEDGCPDQGAHLKKDKIELAVEVHFEVNKAVLKKKSRVLLREVATILCANPQIKKIRIEGHTDSDGDAQANKGLSQDRAESVRQFLISEGVAAERLVAKGLGESMPVASNETARGRSKNRRVDFVLEQVDDTPAETRDLKRRR